MWANSRQDGKVWRLQVLLGGETEHLYNWFPVRSWISISSLDIPKSVEHIFETFLAGFMRIPCTCWDQLWKNSFNKMNNCNWSWRKSEPSARSASWAWLTDVVLMLSCNMLSMMVRQHVIIAKLVISMPTYRIIVITMMIVNDADAGADYHRPNQHQHHHSHQCDHNQSFTW